MNKRERVLAVLQQKEVDYIPGAFWFHFIHEEDTVGEGAVQAHLNYYRSADLDFIKIMSDGAFKFVGTQKTDGTFTPAA